MERPVSSQEARESLLAVDQVTTRTRRAVASHASADLLVLWGSIWAAAYVATQMSLGKPQYINAIWFVLCSLGGVVSLVLGLRYWRAGTPTRQPKLGRRIFAFWFLLGVFVTIWVFISRPRSGIQLNAFLVTALMFAYMVTGLWTGGAYMVWLGLAVTFATLIGYFLMPPAYYCLWMAGTGGGGLLGTGLYLRLRWR